MREFEFINHYLRARCHFDDRLLLGIGDDAATIRADQNHCWHISTDMLLENQHFFSWDDAQTIAYRSLASNFSDMAAMGAKARWVLLSLATPSLKKSWLDKFFTTFFALLDHYRVQLIGGDTCKGSSLIINITIIGETEGRGLQRDNAYEGDDIWHTGRLGLAVAALYHHWHKVILSKEIFEICEQHRQYPPIYLSFMSRAKTLIHAAQDLSDGLLQDLNHILNSSHKGAKINLDAITSLSELEEYPYYNEWILSGGDDYEILFTADKKNRMALLNLAKEEGIQLNHIGEICTNSGLHIMKANQPLRYSRKGFDHFEKNTTDN